MRSVFLFTVGVVVGLGLQMGLAQERSIVGLNHVAFAVDDFDEATNFYTETMGFPEAFAFRDDAGKPVHAYFQVNKHTFIEILPSRPDRPAGFVHYGLEVADLDAVINRLSGGGMQFGEPFVSARTASRIASAKTPQGTSVELLEFGPDSLHRRVIEQWR